MKKGFLFFGFVVIGLISAAQNIHFLKSYGNTGYDYGRDIKQTADTGYIATGSSSSFSSSNSDAFLLKVDSLGNFKWSYNYGGPDSDWGNSVAITYDSTYAVAGYTNSFGAGGFDFYLVRAGEFGVPLWEKTYGGSDWDKANSIAEIPADSGFVLVGETFSYGGGGKDMYIVRTDKNGDTLWTKTYGDSEDDWASGVIVDGDSIVVCGGTESYGMGMTDGIIMKMDLDGNVGWILTAGKDSVDYFTSLVKFGTSYYLAGTRNYHNGAYLGDFWVYRISTDGLTIVVDTTIENGSHELEIAHDITVAQIGDIYFAGQSKSFGYSTIDGLPDAFLGKIISTYWTVSDFRQNFGEAGTDIAWGIDKCFDQGTVAVGDLSFGSTGGNNMFIIKLDKLPSFPADSPDYDLTGPINNPITTAIFEPENQTSDLVVFPNPATDVITIESGENEISGIRIYDMTGKLIHEELNPGSTISVAHLISGSYILQIEINEIFYSYRLIKS